MSLDTSPDIEFDLDVELDDDGSINITPMVDVIFILLVFFLCVSQIKSGKLGIDLPKADRSPPAAAVEKNQKPIAVEVGAKGQIMIAKKLCKNFAEAQKAVDALVKKGGKRQVILFRGDTKANYGNVARMLAMLYNAGLQKIQFEMETGGQ